MSVIAVDINKEILKELTAACDQILIIYKLGKTDLIDSIEWTYKDNAWILVANNYFKWVDSGRRPRVKKVPVEALIKWIKKKNIRPRPGQTINSLAFAIQNSIYKIGIKAKKFIDPMIGASLDIISEYISEDLSVQIADQIATDLTVTIGNK